VDRHLQLVVGVVGPSTVMRGEVAYRLSQTVGRQPPRTGAEWSIAVVHMAVAVGQILRPGELDDSCGDGSDDTRRSKSGARRTTAMVALVGEDERAVLWQKLLTRASFSPTIRPRSSA
jgi:hypothetical protein